MSRHRDLFNAVVAYWHYHKGDYEYLNQFYDILPLEYINEDDTVDCNKLGEWMFYVLALEKYSHTLLTEDQLRDSLGNLFHVNPIHSHTERELVYRVFKIPTWVATSGSEVSKGMDLIRRDYLLYSYVCPLGIANFWGFEKVNADSYK